MNLRRFIIRCGASRPSDLAVFAFMTSSNLVGACTADGLLAFEDAIDVAWLVSGGSELSIPSVAIADYLGKGTDDILLYTATNTWVCHRSKRT
jgi:hypothetical protein